LKRERLWALLPLVAAAGGIAYYALRARAIAGAAGLPLDDSWIHLTLARNLAEGHGFSINPGETVGASTAPLWTLLLVPFIGVVGAAPGVAQALGAVLTLGGAELTRRLYLAYRPDHRREAALAGTVAAVLPSTLWGALSGLEVALAFCLTAASLLAHARLRDRTGWRAFVPPFLMGLLTLARPEALVLFPLSLLDRPRSCHPLGLAGRIVAFVLPLAPIVIFHLAAHGAPLPTTFYAKIHHSRNAAGGQGFFWALGAGPVEVVKLVGYYSFLHVAIYFQTLVAMNPLLVPLMAGGALTCLAPKSDERRIHPLPVLVVVLIPWFIGVFTPRPDLGAGYRYLSFLNPVVGVLAVAGLALAARQVPRWATTGIVLFAIVPLVVMIEVQPKSGAGAYGLSVKNTDEMHVALARWARDSLPAGATAAVHDIGALAFFADLRLIDLEGIGTPSMLAFKRSPASRLQALARLRPQYLIIAPNWYPDLDRRRDLFIPIHVQEIPPEESRVLAGPTMVIYQARWPPRMDAR